MQTASKLSTPSENLMRENKEFQLSFHASRFFARDNFDASTLEVSLPPGNTYTLFKETTSASFGFTENLSVFLNTDFDYSELNTPTYKITNSSFGDSDLGLRWDPKLSFINLMFEIGSVIPLYLRQTPEGWSQINSHVASINGNGTVEPWVLMAPEFPLTKEFLLELGIGAKYRSAGFSNQYLVSAALEFKSARDIFFKLGARYTDTAMEDQYSNNPRRGERSPVLMGSSLYLNSINPTYLTAQFNMGVYLTEKTYLSTAFEQEVWGKNYSTGYMASLGIGFHFGHDDRISSLSHKKNTEFRQYSTSAKISRIDPISHLITIDKGSAHGLKNGEILHIFKVDSTTDVSEFGNFITSARIIDIESLKSRLQIVDIYDINLIKEGFVVRRPLH